MIPPMYAVAMDYLDLGSAVVVKHDHEGLRYPISDREDYVEAYVKSYSAERGGTLSTEDEFDSLMVWMMKGGLKYLCLYAESYTAASIGPANSLEGKVEHPDHGPITLNIEFQYIWGDER